MSLNADKTLILASQSEARARVLVAAGIVIEAVPARIDEDGVTAALDAEGVPPRDVADQLAEMKARRGAQRFPEALVLGSDQVLVCGDETFAKPKSLPDARAQLQRLRGRRHSLVSAAVVFEAGRPVWRAVGEARLTMRDFSDDFLEGYLAAEGPGILDCAGCYRIEGRGAQLFTHVEGDYFSILGLPLLPLLAFLRTRGFCAT